MSLKIYGAKGISLMKLLPRDVLLGRQKTSKIWHDLGQLSNLTKYFQEGIRYWQALNGVINYHSSGIEQKKIWWTLVY